jgi:hypothetical protein
LIDIARFTSSNASREEWQDFIAIVGIDSQQRDSVTSLKGDSAQLMANVLLDVR